MVGAGSGAVVVLLVEVRSGTESWRISPPRLLLRRRRSRSGKDPVCRSSGSGIQSLQGGESEKCWVSLSVEAVVMDGAAVLAGMLGGAVILTAFFRGFWTSGSAVQ